MKKIIVSDYTLRKLILDDAESLLFREKTAIASCLDAIGADRIELPPVQKEKEDTIICKTVARLVQNSALAIPVGYDEKNLAAAWECVREAATPYLQVMLPVATAQMEYGFRAKEAAMLERIAALTAAAREKCENVEFCALDATRADPAFLVKACRTAAENGAACLTLCDDVGTALPEEIAALVKQVKEACTLPLLVSLNDQLGLAAAGALAALCAGADGVKTAMAESGVLSTERFAAMVAGRGESLGLCTALKLTELRRDIAETRKQLHRSYPAAQPESTQANVFLDAESTLSDVCEAAAALGYTLTDEDHGKVYKALQQVCSYKNSVGAKELEALIASNAMQVPSTYHLNSYTASCTNLGSSMAQVSLLRGEETLSGVATGDGPIDSAFRAIEQCVGHHYELDEFQIQAVTEGKEALGSALVRLRSGGKLYVGNGLSTDIVGASIRAYVNALNKIVFEEK